MDFLYLLSTDSTLLTAACGLLGLIVGSFLNVVILRLPKMMEAEWKRESREVLGLPADLTAAKLSLVSPPSTCPSCGIAIQARHNLPVLSWLLLRGRCANCSQKISIQYPLVEAICALASVACGIRFGWGDQLFFSLVLTWSLIALAVIDIRTMLLPDTITLPLIWLGLLLALFTVFVDARASIIGAVAGYMSLWSVYHLFKLLTGKEGMGYGDFKLFAVFGAWMGWEKLPLIILLSSIVGAIVGISLILFRRQSQETLIPFGPYLAGAGWLALLYGTQMQDTYFKALGMHS